MSALEELTATIAMDYSRAVKEYEQVLEHTGEARRPSRDYSVVRAWLRSRSPEDESSQAFLAWLEQHPSFVSAVQDRRQLANLRRLEQEREARLRQQLADSYIWSEKYELS